MKRARAIICLGLAGFLCWQTVSRAQGTEANLVAEAPPGVYLAWPFAFSNVNFCLYYGTLVASVGMHISQITADGILGCGGNDQSVNSEFLHFDASNSHSFARFVQHLTDGRHNEAIGWLVVVFDSNGFLTVVNDRGPIVGPVDVVDRSLYGGTVDFARLIPCTADGQIIQFWSGPPLISVGGQSADVDEFLTVSYPLEKSTAWGGCKLGGSLKVNVTYGPTVQPGTFDASLNGAPFAGFSPVAGTSEEVSVPLQPGRNTLVLSVDGTTADGHVATDSDRLTFLVR